MIVTFIPAAGQSSRMKGRDKLLETAHGTPMLRRAAETALAAGLGPVLVGMRPDDPARRKALDNLAIRIVRVPEADTGMSATLRAGAHSALNELDDAPDDETRSGMLILLPDMPGIEPADLRTLNDTFQSSRTCVRATAQDGTPGHPVLFPSHMLDAFAGLEGDKGAAALMQNQPVEMVPLPGDRATRDLDTPDDWRAWRAETGTPD